MSTPASSSPLSSSCALTFSRLFCSPLRRLAPVATCFIAPFILLLTPILLSLGFGFIVFGLGRAGLIVTYRGGNEEPEILSNDDGRTALQRTHSNPLGFYRSGSSNGQQNGHDRQGGPRRQASYSYHSANPFPSDATGHAKGGGNGGSSWRKMASAARPLVPIKQGTLRELTQVVTGHGGHIVKQVSSLVGQQVTKATREVSGEVEQHLHALQRELQSWAGANPNLKPYCRGHIGWLLRLEAKEIEARNAVEQQALNAASIGSGDGHGSPPVLTNLIDGVGHSVISAGVNGSPGGSGDRLSTQPSKPRGMRRVGSAGKDLCRQRPELDLSLIFEDMYETLPPQSAGSLTAESLDALPLPEGTRWEDLGFLLVPGLLTKWYPLYMKQLRADMKRMGLHVTFSRIDTDQPVRVNAARLRHEILEMAQSGRRVVLMGHSKGAVDCAAAVSLFPELVEFVAGLVSLQGPHGGSAIAHDLANTELQKTIVLGALEKLLRGCKHAILDLSFESRQEFLRQHSYPLHRIPTLCVATCTNRQSSLLTPLIEYITLRYGEVCDGLVCQGDAVLPNSARVVIDDMDHFGPAWGTFPATDRYDPTRLWLSCVSLALRFGAPRSPSTAPSTTPNLNGRKESSRPGSRQSQSS